jgi:hypothetical protein
MQSIVYLAEIEHTSLWYSRGKHLVLDMLLGNVLAPMMKQKIDCRERTPMAYCILNFIEKEKKLTVEEFEQSNMFKP